LPVRKDDLYVCRKSIENGERGKVLKKTKRSGVFREWRWDIAIDLEKDERYFNEKIALGYRPVYVSLMENISFVTCQPNKYLCRSFVCLKEASAGNKNKGKTIRQLLKAEGSVCILNRQGRRQSCRRPSYHNHRLLPEIFSSVLTVL
jgi:hypothetical protein